MKKFFYSVLAAGMLLATSCSQDELVDVTKGEGQQMTFKVELPGTQSRAIATGVEVGAGKYADRLICAMYEHKEESEYDATALITKFVDDTDKDGVFEVTLPMAKKINYDILFMAYDPDNCAFVINNEKAEANDLRALELKGKLSANKEEYDAFVGSRTNQNINSAPATVQLYRPFAQVNVATTLDELKIVDTLKSNVTKSDFKILGAPNKLDILKGSVSGDTDILYEPAAILTKHDANAYPYNELIRVDETSYYYLAMSYVLADASNTNTYDMEFNFYRTDDKPVSDLYVPSVPIQANYRTNIVGTVLTQQENYEVKINPIFVGDSEVLANKAEVNDFVGLQEAVAAAIGNVPTIITLTGDIEIGNQSSLGRASNSENITIAAGKNIILDLNGKTIKLVKECTASFEMINNKGTLTIKDSSENGTGKISFKDTSAGDPTFGWGSYTVRNEGTLVVEGGTIEHLGEQSAHMICAIFQYSGSTTVNGGTISTPYYRSARLWSGDMTINGGTFEGQLWLQAVNNTSDLTINGGTFAPAPKGGDSSSVFVTNSEHDVEFAVTGGTFNTKIGCSDASKLAGCITGGTFTTEAKDNTNIVLFNEDYKLVESNGYWTLQAKDPVAKIGEKGYTSLQKAVYNANADDVITFVSDIEQADGVLITDKNLTIDLNGKTFTVTEGASTNNRNFKINGSSVVTIKNGTMVAQGELTSGAYGTVRTEGTANVTLENVKLYSYRGYGLNVKANSGTTITINDSEIYAQYSGGVEAAGGTINLNNVKIDQKGIYSGAAWCSVAIGVNGEGKVTVNSGNYSAAAISTDANAAQGTWVAYVMSSGGTLEINGGTFNGTVAETAAAANACGIICADRAAVVNINGGTFNSNGAILDMRNNVGTLPNPIATLAGGTFSADPRVSGLYSSNLITVKDGCTVVEANGIWTVKVQPVAKIGETEYETFEAAVAAAQAGDEITLIKDVTLSEELELPAGITLNGNGKQINGTIYAGGNLTIAGHTKVTAFSASYYNRTITIGEDACLEVTGTGRVTLGYGNTFNITGAVENAKSADKTNIQPSLIIPGGISITGGNDAAFNVTNAYVVIGNTSSKNSAANGTFTLNFTNSIAEFTHQFTLSEPTSGKNPTFKMNITNSVFTTVQKLCVAAANSNVVIDNSVVTLGTNLRNSGVIELKNGSVLTGKTIQFGENGGNNGVITVDASELTITAGTTGHAFDGQKVGSITLTNGAKANIDYYKDMTITVDQTSTLTTKVE